ncbi:MAG: hypothetical protein OEY33_07170 [Bdellovibrionales bacterium]|jgi:hypothetical protein|nr:hypothetical protein [Bdellovibrionales bacterium]
MDLEQIFQKIEEFNQNKQGSSDLHSETIFVNGNGPEKFAPLKWLIKKLPHLTNGDQLLGHGFILDSYGMYDEKNFKQSYERLFQRKLTKEQGQKTIIYTAPDNKGVFDTIESIHDSFEKLRSKNIILNGKNLPTQIGEWYARCIFGLIQKKSASQRGFDFKQGNDQVEVKVHWSDTSSPKGVKIKRSLLQLSKYLVLIYLSKNFMIREVCFLDSEFVLRKFATKGHTIFLKDQDLQAYFFSKSSKHDNKVKNPTALLKFAKPTFALKIADRFS